MTTTQPSRPPVLVVGAGPVGLSAALALRAQGLPVSVLEAGPADRPRPGSRAIFVHRESLEHLERVSPGLGWQIAGHGITWGTKRTFWGGQEVFSKTYPPPPRGVLPPSTSLSQMQTEHLLSDACKEAGVDFHWDSQVTRVNSTRSEVRLRTTAGTEWETDYVIAADGARSDVRREVRLQMEGSRSPNSFVIVDIDEDPDAPLPQERVFHYNHPAVDGRNVLLVPFAGGWRADLTCREDDDPEEFNDRSGVQRWLAKVMPERYGERIRWISTYQFLQVLAHDFADAQRRVMLVGEAAHLFAPFGARGMNSGIPDALKAAEAVRAGLSATTAREARAAVEEFASTRLQAAVYNRAAAGQALDHMLSTRPLTRARRTAAARLAVAGRRAGAWLDSAPYGPRGGRQGTDSGTY